MIDTILNYCLDFGVHYSATYVQQQYAIANPLKFTGYCACCWGISASDGPGSDTIKVNGIMRQFYDYI